MSLFISQAHAAAEGAPEAGGFQFIFMMVIFAAIFYFASKESKDNYKKVSLLAITTPEIALDIQKDNPTITLELLNAISPLQIDSLACGLVQPMPVLPFSNIMVSGQLF